MATVVIERPLSLRAGESGQFRVDPMPSPPCRVVIELKLDGSSDWNVMSGANVAGNNVPSPSDVGGFHQTGHSFGRLSLRGDSDASGTLRFTIICEDMDLDPNAFSIVSGIGPTPRPAGRPPKEWDWMVFWGKVLGGLLTSGIAGMILNWWTGVALLPCLATGAAGGAAGAAFGHWVTHVLDAPRRWTFRSAMLFTMFFTLAFAMLFGITASDLEIAAAARGDIYNRVTFGVSVVSAFLAAILPGLLDNLKYDAD
jgi:hypothetical protein